MARFPAGNLSIANQNGTLFGKSVPLVQVAFTKALVALSGAIAWYPNSMEKFARPEVSERIVPI